MCVNNETTIDVVDEEENDNNMCLLFVVLYSSLLLLPAHVVLCLIKKKAEATKQHAYTGISRDDFKTKKIRFFFLEQRKAENISVMSVRRSKLFFFV